MTSPGAFGDKSASLCMGVFYLMPVSRVRDIVPRRLEIVEVLPGLTLGGIYAARFNGNNGTPLSEFGILPAYVRHDSNKGYFLQDLFTQGGPGGDGGADFAWDMDTRSISLLVSTGGNPLISLRIAPLLKKLPIAHCFRFLTIKGENVAFFKSRLASSINLATTTVNIPDDSPLAWFPHRYKLISTYWDASNVVRREPEAMPSSVFKRADEALGGGIGRHPAKGCNKSEPCRRQTGKTYQIHI